MPLLFSIRSIGWLKKFNIMKIIYKERKKGKTTELIKLSAEHHNYIVCHSISEVYRINDEARKMGLNIPFPITYDEFIKGKYYGKGVKGFLIDNAEMLLQYITKVPITAITINRNDNNN